MFLRHTQMPAGFYLWLLLAISAVVGCKEGSNLSVDQVVSYENPIDHVIFIIKENRTFDTYFGAYEPSADQWVEGTTTGMVGSIEIPLRRGEDSSPYVLHEHLQAYWAWNGGAMDGFFMSSRFYPPPIELISLEAYVQYLRDDIPNYWGLADRFVLADHYFTPAMTSTFPNRLHTVAAQSGGFFAPPLITPWDCSNPLPLGLVFDEQCRTGLARPCLEVPTIVDLLEAEQLSWKMYITPRDGEGYFNPLFAIRHIWERAQKDLQYAQEHFPELDHLLVDAANGTLPNVSFVIYPLETSEHAPEGTVCCGEEATVEHVWALMEGPAWEKSFIVLTWNDYGGYYDHVQPPTPQVCPQEGGYYEPGFRVPTIFISPYVGRGVVSHTTYEHASVLKAIGEIFALSTTLHDLDPNAKDAQANSVLDVLNLENPDFSVPERILRTCPTDCEAEEP